LKGGVLVSNDNFERDPRRKQELRGRKYADEIYVINWGDILIKRYEQKDNLILDQKFAIDVTITLPNGMILNGQEKFLSFKYASYGTLTVEHMQDHLTDERGDWYKLAPQFYFCAYFNNDYNGFLKYVIVNWPKLVLCTNSGVAKWHDNKNKDGRARASFRYIYFGDIPNECIIDRQL
jgi:hypothetical protein